MVKKSEFYNSNYSVNGKHDLKKNSFPRVVILRVIFRSLSWCMLVCAFAGFSWGTYLEPIQKNGNAVSLVFDISYSMMAKDCENQKTRLESSVNYAKLLLENIQNPNVSVILAKGDGILALPLTEDRASVESFLDSLSPKMMSSVGTSLGGGVLCALQKFPSKSSLKNRIWLFTDGEETDGKLKNAVEECIKFGINVSIIGFGSNIESEILAGDGKTKILTALRSENLEKICLEVSNLNNKNQNNVKIEFIDSTEPGSALKLLNPLKNQNQSDSKNSEDLTFEVKPVKKYSLFIILALVFFGLSILFSELNLDFYNRKKLLFATIIFSVFLLNSCSSNFKGGKTILTSLFAWNQNQYSKAVSGFFKTYEDSKNSDNFLLNQYALYNLSVSYYSQNELNASLERFKTVSEDAPAEIKFSTFYNIGIIYHQNGNYQKAGEYFKKALEVDSSNQDAKINYEISKLKLREQNKNKENSYKAISESNSKHSEKENSIFNIIKEHEEKQWKNNSSQQNLNKAEDY